MKSVIFKKIIYFSLLQVLIFSLTSETFRVRKVHSVQINQDYKITNVSVGMNDALSISFPEDMTFIVGLELNIKIPEIITNYRDSVVYSLYENIIPAPTQKIIDYEGNRISVNTVPAKLSQTVYIPISSKFSIKESPYAIVIQKTPAIKNNCVFFRFQIAMKGVPESLALSNFDISIKPVLSDEGYFNLKIQEPPLKKETYTVYVDDKLVDFNKMPILLKTGEHHLSITSEAYRNETRTFRIEQIKTTNLDVLLKSIEPTIDIVAPENAKVFLNDKLLTNTQETFIVQSGEHTIKFIIGDYEIVKKVSVINGRSYTVNLNIDATITEE